LQNPANGCAPLHDLAVGQIDLGVLGILRQQPVPVASVERGEMFVEHGLRGWLLLQFRKFHLGLGRRRHQDGRDRQWQNDLHCFLPVYRCTATTVAPLTSRNSKLFSSPTASASPQ
jgi:hypothetical protein